MIADNRKLPSYEIEVLPNGLKQIGVDVSTGVPMYNYYGENAVIVKRTDYILATEDYFISQSKQLATNVSTILSGGSNVKVAVNMGGEFIKVIDGESYYSGTETYADYPTRKFYQPPPAIESYSVDEGIIGYTVGGDAIYMEKSKGNTVTKTVTQFDDPTNGRLVGSIIGSHPLIKSQLSSKSKSNGRMINSLLYYDWSYTETIW